MTAPFQACVLAGSAVLVFAAFSKLRDPRAGLSAFGFRAGARVAQVAACVELVLGVGVLLLPFRLAAGSLAAVFLGFAAAHLSSPDGDCGCLGATPQAGRARPVALTAGAAAGLALISVLATPASPDPPAAALGLAIAWAWLTVFRARARSQPVLGALVDSSAVWLERRIQRRTLVHVAMAGSALSVAPLRYLLYPGSAEAAILPPKRCKTGRCTDGYTAFCCEINQGVNACPEGTFVGGWWMCTDYPGRQLCHEQGVRYYVDCNRIPGTRFPGGGCQCANGNCNERRANCNVFRYGQCSPHVKGVTEVVCRQIVCQNPSTIPELRCSASMAVDNATCEHEAACLQPAALQVTPAGGV